ncbi:MAG TPA: TlpA disulfide reductase family protein [Acidimicrobiales bacterium]|nr:TlpA disulfide reductase family protein [Acidimicrobiales bacterium]
MAARRIHPFPLVIATALAVVVAIGAVALFGDDDDSSADDDAAESDSYQLTPAGELPDSTADVTLAALDGGPDRKLGELLGSTPVVVNFYASWCVPCIREMPAFEAVHRDVGDRVTIIGIAYQDSDELALDTVERTGVTYPTFGDSGQDALTYFGGINMPTTVFIDADGTVVDVRSRAFDEAGLRSALEDHFGIAA